MVRNFGILRNKTFELKTLAMFVSTLTVISFQTNIEVILSNSPPWPKYEMSWETNTKGFDKAQ